MRGASGNLGGIDPPHFPPSSPEFVRGLAGLTAAWGAGLSAHETVPRTSPATESRYARRKETDHAEPMQSTRIETTNAPDRRDRASRLTGAGPHLTDQRRFTVAAPDDDNATSRFRLARELPLFPFRASLRTSSTNGVAWLEDRDGSVMRYRSQISRWLHALHEASGIYCLLLALTVAGTMRAQTAEQTSPFPFKQQGISVSNISVYSSYYSTEPSVATAQSGYHTILGGSAAITWTRSRPRYSMSLSYVPSYIRDLSQDVSYSTLNPINQVFSFTLGQKLSPTWTFTSGVSTSVLNTTAFLFQPSQSAQVAGAAATPDQLAAAVLGGGAYDNGQLSALLSSAPLLESPAQRQAFGDRIFNATFRAGASHTKSRLTVSFFASGSRVQALSTQTTQSTSLTPSLLPSATSGQANVTVSYALSPRTQFGVSVAENETSSRFADDYTSTALAQFRRRMGMRWMVDLHAGTGVITSRRSAYQVPSGPQLLAGGSLGVKAASHSILFSADRSVIDQYGLGASSTVSTTAAWSWGRPNRGWKITASGGLQQFHIAGFQAVSGWQGNVGFSQVLARGLAVQLAYAYLQNSQNLVGLPGNWSITGVRTGLVWNP